ncbi:MAG: hypothetical protein ABI679_13540 [Gemmatimonadota bacterium]
MRHDVQAKALSCGVLALCAGIAVIACRTPAPGTDFAVSLRADTAGLSMVAPGVISTAAPEFALTLSLNSATRRSLSHRPPAGGGHLRLNH